MTTKPLRNPLALACLRMSGQSISSDSSGASLAVKNCDTGPAFSEGSATEIRFLNVIGRPDGLWTLTAVKYRPRGRPARQACRRQT